LEFQKKKLSNLWGKNYNNWLPEAISPLIILKIPIPSTLRTLVMAELVSTDPLKEMRYAQTLANDNPRLSAAIANITFWIKIYPTS